MVEGKWISKAEIDQERRRYDGPLTLDQFWGAAVAKLNP